MGFLADRRARKRAETAQRLHRITMRMLTSPDAPAALLEWAVEARASWRPVVAANPVTPPALLAALSELGDPGVDEALAGNPAWVERPVP